MRIQAYNAFAGVLTITVATPRPEAAPSTHFFAASIHEDFCAKVRALLKEHKHIGATSLAYPAAQRLPNFLPVFDGAPLFALRELMPAGSPRDVDPEFQIEIMRIRYQFTLELLPAAHLADEVDAAALERHVESATRQLFQANAVPDVFIPGDTAERPHRTEIDISCEFGAATARGPAEIPAP